jgi:serine/threonine-protein kinase
MRLGGYTIQRFVRAGTTGELYIARRVGAPSLSPEIAIKVITPGLVPTPRAWRSLEDDLRRAGRIDDPRVVRIEETGDDGAHHYVAMECVRGFSLADILAFYQERGRMMKPTHAVYIAMQAALALQSAMDTRDEQGHALRIVHGAISPRTILVSWRGHVKLVKFGLARAKPTPSDSRTDIFALGGVLWTSLTGDVLARAGAELSESVPEYLAEPIARALDPVPDRRPNAGAFFRELVAASPDAAQVTPGDIARELAAIRLDQEFSTFAQDRAMVGASFVPPRMTEPPEEEVVVPRQEDASRLAAAASALLGPRVPTERSEAPTDPPPPVENAVVASAAETPPAPPSQPVAPARLPPPAPPPVSEPPPPARFTRTAIGIAAFAAGILATTILGVVTRSRAQNDGLDSGRELVTPQFGVSPPLMGVPLTQSSAIPTASVVRAPPPPVTTASAVLATNPSASARRDDLDASAARDAASSASASASASSGKPIAAASTDGGIAARDGGAEDTPFDRATARAVSGDLAGARSALEARFAAGTADANELSLLRAICRQQRDVECVSRLRGHQPK